MADIANIKPVARTIEIRHPATGRPIGIRVSLVSIDDERLTKVKRAITDKRLHLEARGKTFKAEEIEENRIKINMTAMTGWEWYNPTGKQGDEGYDAEEQATFNGEVPDYKPSNVRAVLTELSWFGDQINEAIGETESFFKG